MKSLLGEDDNDTANDDFKQIEVSHGSTSNQTSIYASTIVPYWRTTTFCCDIVYILVILVIICGVTLLWCNLIPGLSVYFEKEDLQVIKIEILAGFMSIVFILFVILLRRCFARSPNRSCLAYLRYIFNWRYTKMVTIESFSESTDSGVNTETNNTREKTYNSANPRINELDVECLSELKRILRLFLNYHDKSDWTFLGSSYSRNITSCSKLVEKAKLKVTMKIVLVGNPNVGKTSIFHRILYDRFTEYYMATLGVDLGIVTLQIFPENLEDNILITLQVWDIAGSEKFSELSHIVYKDTNAYLLICDITDLNFMGYALPWIRDIQNSVCEPYISLFFNKIDKGNMIATPVLDHDFYNFESYSVSAKTGEKVLENLVDVVVKSLLHAASKCL